MLEGIIAAGIMVRPSGTNTDRLNLDHWSKPISYSQSVGNKTKANGREFTVDARGCTPD